MDSIYRVYFDGRLVFEGKPLEVLRYTKRNKFDEVYRIDRDGYEWDITMLYR